jgi:hypothetical protein
MKKLFVMAAFASLLLCSCKSTSGENDEENAEGKVPVTVTSANYTTMVDGVELNATSTFLLKTSVKSNVNGYLQEVNVQLGQQIKKGKRMFVIKSKEAHSIGNSIASLDPSLHFNGLISIPSPGSGYVTQLAYQAGDYVQDGEILATISDANSLVFMLELPYELKPYLSKNKTLQLVLPDGQKLFGTITRAMPSVDPVSQTQSYVVKVPHASAIPENLVAKVMFVKSVKSGAVSLPKDAIVTDETQSNFWVMKMVGRNTAVKVLIKKGIETSDRVEILSPILKPTDKILLTGNYGLPDTAKVTIMGGEK